MTPLGTGSTRPPHGTRAHGTRAHRTRPHRTRPHGPRLPRARRAAAALATAAALLGAGALSPTAPAPQAATPYRYVALGDSFASTGSVVGMDPATFGSADTGSAGSCFRSADTYPRRLAASTDWAVTDVTCRGGRVSLMGTRTGVYGAAQLDAVTADADLVTVQVGGNDTDVLELARRCLTSVCTGLEPEWTAKVEAVRAPMLGLLREIRARAPHARVVVVGYHQPFPEVPCLDVAPFSAANQGFGRRHVGRLDAMLRDTARQAGVEIVGDVTPPGHSACDPDRWTSFLGVDAGAVPLHPTAAGHAAYAGMIRGLVGR